jgi:hypothetical protein
MVVQIGVGIIESVSCMMDYTNDVQEEATNKSDIYSFVRLAVLHS